MPRPKTCGDALSNLALEELASLGVSALTTSAPVVAARAVFPSGYSVSRSYRSQPGAIVPRLALDALIAERAVAAGATLLEETRASAVERSASPSSPLRLKVQARGERAERTLKGRAVIAADGPGSVGWRLLGCERPRASALGIAVTGYYAGLKADAAGLSEHYFAPELPYGYYWVFPAVNGEANVGVYQRVDAYKRGGERLEARLESFISAHPERFSEATRVGALKSWQLPISSFRLPPAGPGLLCAGDAAHSVDALTGEGIYQALYSGRLAAETIAASLSQDGYLTARAARRYQVKLARAVHLPQAARREIQRGIAQIVERGLERRRVVQQLLELGYGGGALELTKRVSAR